MSRKIFHGAPTFFLLCLFGYSQISNADVYCQYVKGNDPTPYYQSCPNACCMNTPRNANTTCCNPPSTFTLFGYSWWTIFSCAICLVIALSILIHYAKRIHFLKHSKCFNSTVDPVLAYTISKSELDIKANDSAIILEQNPPSYASSASPPPPPPTYASIHP